MSMDNLQQFRIIEKGVCIYYFVWTIRLKVVLLNFTVLIFYNLCLRNLSYLADIYTTCEANSG